MKNKLPPTRGSALLLALIGGGLLAFNHWSATNEGKVYLWGVFAAPMLLLLGIGGLIDPTIAVASAMNGPRTKVIRGVLIAVGLLISVALAFGVYRLQDGMSKP